MEDARLCYICYEQDSNENPYVSEPAPCICKGSIVIHKACLENVIKTSRFCSICKSKYDLTYLPSKNGLELVAEVAINGDIKEYTVDELGEQHGECTVRKQSGELIERCYYTNGELDGEYTTWYPNGQVECVCHCVRNRIEGDYKSWYDNGSLMEHSVYKDGLKDGILNRWDRAGNFVVSIVYSKGDISLPYFIV